MNTQARFGSGDLRLFKSTLRVLTLLTTLLLVAGASGEARAATRTLGAGANLQQALDAAQPGDTLVLEAGAAFVGIGGKLVDEARIAAGDKAAIQQAARDALGLMEA